MTGRTGMHPGVAAAAACRSSRVSSPRLSVSCVEQTPAAHHVVRQGKSQSDYLGLFQTAHHELLEAVVAHLRIGKFHRGCALLVDVLGSVTSHALSPRWHRW